MALWQNCRILTGWIWILLEEDVELFFPFLNDACFVKPSLLINRIFQVSNLQGLPAYLRYRRRNMEWDVAIVGAGMGGAAFGYALAMQGYRILFIEKGLSDAVGDGADDADAPDPIIRLSKGRWPSKIIARVDNEDAIFYPPIGCGAGGSTLLYAGTLERLARQDFVEAPQVGKPSWPFAYDEIEPFYRMAEGLFQVTGTPDPFYVGPRARLGPAATMTSSDAELFKLLQANGVQPYRSHNIGQPLSTPVMDHQDSVREGGGRGDAKHVFLLPAIASGGAAMLDRCTVDRIEADEKGVRGLICTREGQEIRIQAQYYALAAGALSTPQLLLRSANSSWPRGIANSSDMVGRNLMFHVSDFVAVWPGPGTRAVKAERAIAIRDFYTHQQASFGLIQSTGMAATARNVVHVLKIMINSGPLKRLRPITPVLQLVALAGARILGRATIFATIMEDYPYLENRVRLHRDHPDTIYFEYCIKPELRRRVRRFRQIYRRAFKSRLMLVLTPNVNLNFGHACGTCRAGSDPRSSVVNAQNRSHDLDNLYVVDSSSFPTSGGVNPSLTIAANALRAGALLAERLKHGQRQEEPIP
jgi:choline dehydrogenase-like flavoprotein